MTDSKIEFLTNIENTYKKYDALIKKDVTDFITKNIDDDKLSELLQLIIFNQETRFGPPDAATINRIAKDNKFQKRDFNRFVKKSIGYFRCDNIVGSYNSGATEIKCNTPYSIHFSKCPKCDDVIKYHVVQSEEFPQNYMGGQESCCVCPIYTGNNSGCYCPGYSNNKISNQEREKYQCCNCECQKCCKNMSIYKHDPQYWRQMVHDNRIKGDPSK